METSSDSNLEMVLVAVPIPADADPIHYNGAGIPLLGAVQLQRGGRPVNVQHEKSRDCSTILAQYLNEDPEYAKHAKIADSEHGIYAVYGVKQKIIPKRILTDAEVDEGFVSNLITRFNRWRKSH
jgi:hypothetical protein